MISSDVVVADNWPPLTAREIPAVVLMAPLDTGANADVENEHDTRKRAVRAHCDMFIV